MTESLQDRWQETDDLQTHMERAQEALAIMEQEVVLPTDRRWQVAYSVLATSRGQESGVLAIGPFGTAKTTLGNLMLGREQRISINSTDTEQTLFGHRHPMPTEHSPSFIPGKFEVVDPTNPSFYLNELTHMRNQKPVQQLWDSDTLSIHGEVVSLRDAAYYITSNFANGRDVHPLTPSIRSRIGAEVLTGDVDEETARAIQSAGEVSFADAPILPSAGVRKTLTELVEAAYPNPEDRRTGRTLTGDFAVDLISRMNESGLTASVSAADARIGKALAAASRALMFERKVNSGIGLHPLVIAGASALVMPTVVKLSGTAEGNLIESLGRPAEDLEKAIAIRRIVARTAHGIAFDYMMRAEQNSSGGNASIALASPEEIARRIEDRTDRFSYADVRVLPYDIDKAVLGPDAQTSVAAEPDQNRRGVRNGLRRFIGH